MTNASAQFLKENNIVPNLSFKDGKSHLLKYIKSEVKTMTFNSEEKKGVIYMFTEDNEPKKYFTAALSFIQPMAEVEENEELKIQMVRKSIGGQVKSFFNIEKVKSGFISEEGQELPKTEDIPVVEESEINVEDIPY